MDIKSYKSEIIQAIQECLWTTCSGIGETLPLSIAVQRCLGYTETLDEIQYVLNEAYPNIEGLLH